MKYLSAKRTEIQNGPGGKPLNMVYGETEIEKEEFDKIINDFIDEAGFESAEKKAECKSAILIHLHAGTAVTLDNITLTIKK